MSELELKAEGVKATEAALQSLKPTEKLPWETPRLEDVSEQVMAQPYIRFT